MNYSRSIFLVSEEARAIMTTYELDTHSRPADRTMFKTLDPSIQVDDYVVVPTDTRHGMTVVKVAEVDVDPDLESVRQLDWIISAVDRNHFEECKANEDRMISIIKEKEKDRKRRELRETLLAGAEDEIKALPIYSKPADEKAD